MSEYVEVQAHERNGRAVKEHVRRKDGAPMTEQDWENYYTERGVDTLASVSGGASEQLNPYKDDTKIVEDLIEKESQKQKGDDWESQSKIHEALYSPDANRRYYAAARVESEWMAQNILEGETNRFVLKGFSSNPHLERASDEAIKKTAQLLADEGQSKQDIAKELSVMYAAREAAVSERKAYLEARLARKLGSNISYAALLDSPDVKERATAAADCVPSVKSHTVYSIAAERSVAVLASYITNPQLGDRFVGVAEDRISQFSPPKDSETIIAAANNIRKRRVFEREQKIEEAATAKTGFVGIISKNTDPEILKSVIENPNSTSQEVDMAKTKMLTVANVEDRLTGEYHAIENVKRIHAEAIVARRSSIAVAELAAQRPGW